MRRYSRKYRRHIAPAPPKQQTRSQVASLVFGAFVMMWSGYSLRLYANEMAFLLEQLSQSTQNGTGISSADFSKLRTLPDHSLPNNVLRITQLRETRPTRHVMNQDDYRQDNNCPANLPEHDVQTTLVTQLDTQRLWLAKVICTRWKNPIVMVVYFANQGTYDNLAESFRLGIDSDCPHVEFVFVVDDTQEDESTLYPINLLRNLALERVQTSHVLLSDADFLPSTNLAEEIQNALEIRQEARQALSTPTEDRDALVVPAFEAKFNSDLQQQFLENTSQMAQLIPHDLDGLRECFEASTCAVFHQEQCPLAHSSTRSHRWLDGQWYNEITDEGTGASIKDIQLVPCMESFKYEPYMVLPWCPSGQAKPERIAPLYDERFLGYGFNKVQYVEHIRHYFYDFYVVPKGFLVHAPHPISAFRLAHDSASDTLRSDTQRIWKQFQEEVHNIHGHEIRFQKCTKEQRMDLAPERQTTNSPPDDPAEPTAPLFHNDGDESQNMQFFDTSSKSRVLRMTSLRQARTTREVSNQEDYRYVNNCPANLQEDQLQTTLVTQLDTSRLWLAKEVCSRWKDPLVILVYFGDEMIFSEIAVPFRKEIETDCPHVDLLFVVNDSKEEILYPINLLRNLALEAARTSHVLLHDADFLPSEDLSKEIKNALHVHRNARQRSGSREYYDAMVVPAFQIEFREHSLQEKFLDNPRDLAYLIPRQFSALQECINSTNCSVFHETHYTPGHSSTRTHLWLKEQWYQEIPDPQGEGLLKDIKPVRCMDSQFYEPYLVLPWCPFGEESPQRISPLYDERFDGYGMNKVQFIEHIRHFAYEFFIVPKGFLIHAPHSLSAERVAWDRDSDSLRSDNKALYRHFKDEIHEKYGHDIRLRRCTATDRAKMEEEETDDDFVETAKAIDHPTDLTIKSEPTSKRIQIEFFSSPSLKARPAARSHCAAVK